MNPTTHTTDPQPKLWRRRWFQLTGVAILGLLFGAALGGAASAGGAAGSSAPAPVKTVVQTETETIEVVDTACRTAAVELRSILQDTTDNVVLKYIDVTQILYENMIGGINVSEIDRGTALLNEIAETADGLTQRITAIQPTYSECTQ